MASNAPQLASAFPPPPPFYKAFTDENLALLASGTDEAKAANDDLEFLTPPPVPTGGYRSFGQNWNIPDTLPTLKEMGITQLYPDEVEGSSAAGGRAKELKRLAKSLLIGYLELVGILGYSPSEFPAKIQDLRTILINMHHLINEYRPHQARETLILNMEEQLERVRNEVDNSRKVREKAEELLKQVEGISQEYSEGAEAAEPRTADEAEKAASSVKDMESWKLVEELLKH